MKDTNCKDCTFLTTESISNPGGAALFKNITVCDCELNKLKLYEDSGIKIKPAEYGVILQNFICPFKRGDSWEKSNKYDSIEDQIIDENGFPYSAFIYENDEVNIEAAVDQLLKFDHKPKYLHVTFKYMRQDDAMLQRLSKRIEKEKDVKYKLMINLDKDTDNFYSSYLAFRLNVNTDFIAIVKGLYVGYNTWTTKLSKAIQKDLLSFPYANSKNKNFMVYPTSILEEYLQFEGEHFLDKIEETQCQNYEL